MPIHAGFIHGKHTVEDGVAAWELSVREKW